MSEERRVTSDTGGQKGQKLARFASIPPDVLWELAEHYGKGQEKYEDDPETGMPNWMKGYDWWLTVDALERHLNLWKQGEELDPETGSSHLIAVIWHAIALRWFVIHEKGKDYRYATRSERADSRGLSSEDREHGSKADDGSPRVGGSNVDWDPCILECSEETRSDQISGGTNHIPFDQGERRYADGLGESLEEWRAANYGFYGY